MRELTKNEKVLLGLLGIVLIGWGSYQFIITPQSEKLETFKAEKLEYQEKVNEINAILSRENDINKSLDMLKEEKDQIASTYFPRLDQAQTTYLLNDLLAVDEIKIVDMNFTKPSYQVFEEFEVKHMDISIPYEGTYDGIIGMIRSLKNSPRKILIDRVSMDMDKGDSLEGKLEGNIDLKVYGLDNIVDTEEEVVKIHTEKRALMSTPFSVYSSYKENQPSKGADDLQGINPYNPDFSLDYDKDNEISFIPDEEVK